MAKCLARLWLWCFLILFLYCVVSSSLYFINTSSSFSSPPPLPSSSASAFSFSYSPFSSCSPSLPSAFCSLFSSYFFFSSSSSSSFSTSSFCPSSFSFFYFSHLLFLFVLLLHLLLFLHDREVACSPSDRQGSNSKLCVWRAVSSHSSYHPQEVLLAQLSLHVHNGGLQPHSLHFHFPHEHVSID